MADSKSTPPPEASALNPSTSRRTFLKVTAMAGAALATQRPKLWGATVETAVYGHPDVPDNDPSASFVRSVCLMCNSNCGIQAKIVGGRIVKIDGNPYHPNCMLPTERIPYTTPPEEANLIRGHNCVKSQAAMQTIYDPYRLRGPLKRVGPRGGGQWQEISWKQALDEIAAALLPYYKPTTPIDSAFPEFGNIPNKVAFSAGRWQNGQSDLTDRVFKNGFGTANSRHDHTAICEVSHHSATRLVTDNATNHFKPDILSADLLLWFGMRPLEASFPMQTLSRRIAQFLARGGRMITVDPVLSNTAARSQVWLPIIPGTDAALALGMARWMLDNNAYDINFLTNTKAGVNGESSYSDATFLVRLDTGAFLRDSSSKNLVWNGGKAYAAGSAPGFKGELDPGVVTVNGVQARTAFSLLVERAREKSLDEYASICGIDAATIASVARDFAAAGKRGVADFYRGAVKHTNGTYNALAIMTLNILNGNFDWKGGYSVGGGAYSEMGGKPGQVTLAKVPGATPAKGVPISRHAVRYDKDAPNLFARDGYPAKRPWYPFDYDWTYYELLPSIKAGYPYQVEVLLSYWNDVLYSAPAARNVGEQVLADESKLKLHVAFDILIGETSKWADYILPDTTWLERWTTPHVAPAIENTCSGFRQPLAGSYIAREIQGKTRLFYVSPLSQGNVALDFWSSSADAQGPQLIDDIWVALFGRVGIPGIGPGAFDLTGAASGYDWRSDFYSAWDWYLNMLNNWSVQSGVPVEDIVARGGVFEPVSGNPGDPSVAYNGNFMKHPYGKIVHLYFERLATTPNSMTGRPFDPMPKYEPVQDSLGRPYVAPGDFPFKLIAYRNVYMAQARTICNPALQGLQPTNFIEMNASDGASLGLQTGDQVRMTGAGGLFITGLVRLTEGMRPGVVGIPHSYGHWEVGSNGNNIIDGKPVDFDPARALGVIANPITTLDPHLGDATLSDLVGGSAMFMNHPVKIERA